MIEEYIISRDIIKKLGCINQYYNNGSMYWFEKDPTVVFIIRKNGDIIIRGLWSNQIISIYELWSKFSNEQKKLIAYNLDRFV